MFLNARNREYRSVSLTGLTNFACTANTYNSVIPYGIRSANAPYLTACPMTESELAPRMISIPKIPPATDIIRKINVDCLKFSLNETKKFRVTRSSFSLSFIQAKHRAVVDAPTVIMGREQTSHKIFSHHTYPKMRKKRNTILSMSKILPSTSPSPFL